MFLTICVGLILIYFIRFLIGKLRVKELVSPNGKAVLITGCDSGFGNRTAHRLNAIGFKVYATVLSTDSPGAQQLKSNAVFAEKMIVLQMNVTNDREVNEVYEKVKDDLQNSKTELWALVNNAGILTAGLLDWGTLDTYHKMFEVNVFGTVRVTRVFLPLIKTSKGRIINMNSINSRFATIYIGIYSMTKHSLIAFTDTLRRELAKFKISVISVEPGYFKTAISDHDTFIKHMNRNWSESTPEVKQFYGSPHSEKKFRNKLLDRLSEDNLDVCVDDIIDAVVNSKPKTVYNPMNLISKITLAIFNNIPTQICDSIMALYERVNHR